ncbi:HET domain-containing protein [Rutstroemia sp. NJR-2017a WRK4]|nr:HET domain-containing protein [Rutstroemia sp. NJR-2017a WRK4]
MAHSCTHCQQYVLVRPRTKEDIYWVEVLEVDSQVVVDAASNGCAFFNWCLLQQPEPSHPIHREELKENLKLRARMWAGERHNNSTGQFLWLRWEEHPASEWVEGGQGLDIKSLFIMAEVGVCLKPLSRATGDPAARYNAARPIHRSVASAAKFDLGRTWLDKCSKVHPSCKSPRRDSIPLRLIEISCADTSYEPKIRLVSNTGKLLYAALSYCWGNPSFIEDIKLSNKTYPEWLDDIPFSRLPKSLQDGVIATWKLGLRFLWIDCLCIFQDNNTEKAIEIAKMPEIYRGAYVTISAARSTGSNQGFLHDIQVPSVEANIFKMAYVCPDGRLGSILLFDDSVPQMMEPIDYRGWTLQEHILSPRLLIYGVHGLRFNCREVIQHDDEEAATGSLSSGNNQKLSLLRDIPSNSEIARNTWARTLVEYSGRTLSHPGDRLLAISGVAKYYSEILNDRYLAGIWLRDLPAALMWENISTQFQRPLGNRAPSWSWAAIDGAVENFKLSVPVDPYLSVISHDIQLIEPAAPFGDVSSGHLTLKGFLREASWNGIALVSSSFPSREYMTSTVSDAIESELTKDGSVFIKVWCLQIHPFDESRHMGPSGLILARVYGQTFRRLGIFSFDANDVSPELRDADFYSQLDIEQREWAQASEMQEFVIL